MVNIVYLLREKKMEDYGVRIIYIICFHIIYFANQFYGLLNYLFRFV